MFPWKPFKTVVSVTHFHSCVFVSEKKRKKNPVYITLWLINLTLKLLFPLFESISNGLYYIMYMSLGIPSGCSIFNMIYLGKLENPSHLVVKSLRDDTWGTQRSIISSENEDMMYSVWVATPLEILKNGIAYIE